MNDGREEGHLPLGPVNAITVPLLNELCSRIALANADNGVRGIVIAGDDKRFSAGADLSIFKGVATHHSRSDYFVDRVV